MTGQTIHEDGEAWRQLFGIDGTAGDAQDVDHPYVPADYATGAACVVCGLARPYRRHTSDWETELTR